MAEPATTSRLIKRYADARFYDVGTASYVSVEDIADSVHAGDGVRVVDAKTGQDVTQTVLAPIMRRPTEWPH